MNLLWLRNISKEEMAMLGMEHDRNMRKETFVGILKEYCRRWCMNSLEIHTLLLSDRTSTGVSHGR